jgi:hypothetical protein
MSWGTCFSGSNNIHFDFPPIMADGRNYASWQPEAVINNRIQKEANINNNWNYRQYLQEHGMEIMKTNALVYCNELGVNPYIHNHKQKATKDANVPHLYSSSFDKNNPSYGYTNSDLKNPYLSREQLNSRMISPTIQMNKNGNTNPNMNGNTYQ